MLLTVKELAQQLQIKPGTLYAWAAQAKIPSRKIHGLLRFDRGEIEQWLSSFVKMPAPSPASLFAPRNSGVDIDRLIARAKRDVYTARHGETRLRSSLIGKEERDGAREAE